MNPLAINSRISQLEVSILHGLRRALDAADSSATLICRVQISNQLIKIILGLPKIKSIILSKRVDGLFDLEGEYIGYYEDDSLGIFFPKKVEKEVIYIGPSLEFGARAVFWVMMKGGRKITFCINPFSCMKSNVAVVFLNRALSSSIFRLNQLLQNQSHANKFVNHIFKMQMRYREKKIFRSLNVLSDHVSNQVDLKKESDGIIFIGAGLGPGGAERQLVNTLSGLSLKGFCKLHFLHYWAMMHPNDFYLPKLAINNIPYSQVRMSPLVDCTSLGENEFLVLDAALGSVADVVGYFVREFEERSPSIVHIWLDEMNVTAGLAALIVGVPKIILSCRSMAPDNFLFYKSYMRPIYEFMSNFENVYFLSNSKAGADDYKRWLKSDDMNFKVIRNGFDFSLKPKRDEWHIVRREYRRRVKIPSEANVVGVVMRIAEEKRPHLWIEVARKIIEKNLNTHFLIVGDGDLRIKLESLTLIPSLQNHFHFVGIESDVYPPLLAMDIFLLTSRIEGLPNVLIEAQSVGVPVVTTDVGGASETLDAGKTGYALKTSDPSILANKILSILGNPAWLSEARLNAPIFVESHFSQEKMISETIKVYGCNSKK